MRRTFLLGAVASLIALSAAGSAGAQASSGQYNSSAPSLTNGATRQLQLDQRANLHINPNGAITTAYQSVGANAYTFTPAAGTQWQLVFAHVVYTADATVGSRYITMQLIDGSSNVVGDWHTSAAITAGQAGYHIEFLPGTYRETAFDANHTIQTPFASGLIVPSGYTLKIFDGAAISAMDSMVVSVEYVSWPTR